MMIKKLQNFLQTDKGQRILQYFYSYGAAVVIFGVLIKVLHIWGYWGNVIFTVGMITECFVFVLFGLDRQKKDYNREKVFPVLESDTSNDKSDFENLNAINKCDVLVNDTVVNGETPTAGTASNETQTYNNTSEAEPTVNTQSSITSAICVPMEQFNVISDNVHKFTQAIDLLTKISESLAYTYQPIIDSSQDINKKYKGYVQQMESIDKNISGINTFYEIQLKGISSQLETLENINKGLKKISDMYTSSVPYSLEFKQETEKMTQQLKDLNQVYGRMLQAMTVNVSSNSQTTSTPL